MSSSKLLIQNDLDFPFIQPPGKLDSAGIRENEDNTDERSTARSTSPPAEELGKHLFNQWIDILRELGLSVDAKKQEVDFSPKPKVSQQNQARLQAGINYGRGGYANNGFEHPLMRDAAEFAGVEHTKESPVAATNTNEHVLMDWLNELAVNEQIEAATLQQLANQLQHSLQYNPQLMMKVQQQLEYVRKKQMERSFNPTLNPF